MSDIARMIQKLLPSSTVHLRLPNKPHCYWRNYDIIIARPPVSRNSEYYRYWAEEYDNRGSAELWFLHDDPKLPRTTDYGDFDRIACVTEDFEAYKPSAPESNAPWFYLPYTRMMPLLLNYSVKPGDWTDFEWFSGYAGLNKKDRVEQLAKLWRGVDAATGGRITVPGHPKDLGYVTLPKVLNWYREKCGSVIFVTSPEQRTMQTNRFWENMSATVAFVSVQANPTLDWYEHQDLYVQSAEDYLSKLVRHREDFCHMQELEWAREVEKAQALAETFELT